MESKPTQRTVRNIRRHTINHYSLPVPTQSVALRKPKAKAEPIIVCDICSDHVPASKFPKAGPSAACTHPPETCNGCAQRWITTLMSMGDDRLDCAQCSNELTHTEVKQLLGPKDFQRLDDQLLKKYLASCPEFQWCLSTSCKSGQFHCGKPLFECDVCHQRACIFCGVPWHEDMTCETFQAGKAGSAEEEATKQTMAKATRQCPTCKAHIQRSEGCNMMTCAICATTICWLCGEIMGRGPQSHKRGCAYGGRPVFVDGKRQLGPHVLEEDESLALGPQF